MLLIFVCAASSSFAVDKNSDVLKYNLGGTESWMPYGYFGDANNPGIFAEVIELILKRTNRPYDVYYFPPKRAGKVFEEDRLDLDFMSPSWFKNGDMGEDYVSTMAIFPLSEYIVTLSEKRQLYAEPESINGKRIGTIAGYNYYDDDKFTRVDFLSESALVKGLKMQRFDAVILEGVTAKYWAKIHEVNIALASIHSQGDIVIRLRRELKYLLPELNAAIQALKNEGEIDRILQHYSVR